ncbi:isocitrate lyase/phosphoenolpyruvate mutase family protein [Pedobacter cryoconitis]|uniref:2-methylisocitrate lyase-like PEP mutase family enzyme n=1 Tax=Pedobacter cryoconitis TaxID=188932 RepID=A0A7X0MM07_9SPHI|nr:isocitrate lyase/phosphoenolpyruvate mutase family protein [Pedobacter cryoconitis]MBB6501963.1 2-methylisocitrate lyase-like PEP mutase family enzyme [Pedobacter cryoconitis]
MMTSFEKFRDLHNQENLLLIGNVWNVQSALVYERAGFEAVATSSSAVAQSLGYEDGEDMPFNDYLFIIERIVKSVKLPVSVDLEAGYGDTPEKVVSNILKLVDLGVAGINIEDSLVRDNKRTIQDAAGFTAKLKAIKDALKARNAEIFINVRCDTYILDLPDAHTEAKRRIKLYETADIDGLFLPFIIREQEISEIAGLTRLPVHVMCMPKLPGFEKLQSLGVKRVSMGGYVYRNVYKQLEVVTKEIIDSQSFDILFN